MTSTGLKLIALALMLCDHIAEFIPGAPLWLHWIGRISAPLFLFCMVWGYSYTKNRKRYLLRMYLFGAGMGLMDLLLNNLFAEPYQYAMNNIFVMLLVVAVLISILECRRTDRKKGNRWLLLFIVFQLVSTAICFASTAIPLSGAILAVSALLPNLLFCEGGPIFVALGILLYYGKGSRRDLVKTYGIFCLIFFFISCVGNFTYEWMFLQNYQWMQVAALPLMCLYNGKRGAGLKYLFYIFYPAHVCILFLLGNLAF